MNWHGWDGLRRLRLANSSHGCLIGFSWDSFYLLQLLTCNDLIFPIFDTYFATSYFDQGIEIVDLLEFVRLLPCASWTVTYLSVLAQSAFRDMYPSSRHWTLFNCPNRFLSSHLKEFSRNSMHLLSWNRRCLVISQFVYHHQYELFLNFATGKASHAQRRAQGFSSHFLSPFGKTRGFTALHILGLAMFWSSGRAGTLAPWINFSSLWRILQECALSTFSVVLHEVSLSPSCLASCSSQVYLSVCPQTAPLKLSTSAVTPPVIQTIDMPLPRLLQHLISVCAPYHTSALGRALSPDIAPSYWECSVSLEAMSSLWPLARSFRPNSHGSPARFL